jgi:diaminopimelate epimerase
MIRFTKMQGLGNDFILVDTLRDGIPESDLSALSRTLNDRHFGVGGDGLILIEPSNDNALRMRMFNPDGSESEMCGNGIRCFARLVLDRGYREPGPIPVDTGAGRLVVNSTEDGRIRVDMGIARITRGEIGMTGPAEDSFIHQPFEGRLATAVSMGNPHVVVFESDLDTVVLGAIGPQLEHSPLFPNRVNVHFAHVVDRTHVVQKTWERGAGETLACGTGACAVAVASWLNGHTDAKVNVKLPGGQLDIEIDADRRVWMTGPAVAVFEGVWPTAA